MARCRSRLSCWAFQMGAKHVTAEELAFIKRAYRSMRLVDVVAAVNERFGVRRTYSGMKQFVVKRGIHSGRTGCFEKGFVPWNKGKKGVNGYSSTRFAPGQAPHNALPIFSERIGKDGEVQIKVRERGRAFISKARWLWEQKNGPLPKGCVIRFRDGNNRNFRQSNLICVTRHVHLRLNASDYAQLPAKLKPTRLLVETLVATVKERAAA